MFTWACQDSNLIIYGAQPNKQTYRRHSLMHKQPIYESAWLKRSTKCKCFTCVTKTIANLTTYSRKPGDYNGTIIFEIDIMKNSSPLNLNLFQTWLVVSFVLIYCWLLWSWAESAVSPAENKCYFGFDGDKRYEF